MRRKPVSRRRFLSICAMAGAVTATPWAQSIAASPLHRWQGILLGAEVNITLAHPDRQQAERLFDLCVTEIKRLENIFTLYDTHSELSQLNSEGQLKSPSSEMVDILQLSQKYHALTERSFDITVGALEHSAPLSAVGMDKLHVSENEISFTKPNMRLTLNGIAQGYITDRLTAYLKNENMKNVLVELGEKRAIGKHPSGRPWFIALQGQNEPVALDNMALATSAFKSGDTGKQHILNPMTGLFAHKHNTVSVIAETAAMADALSTGFLSLSRNKINAIQKTESAIKNIYIS